VAAVELPETMAGGFPEILATPFVAS
jgi:hypothetical protein